MTAPSMSSEKGSGPSVVVVQQPRPAPTSNSNSCLLWLVVLLLLVLVAVSITFGVLVLSSSCYLGVATPEATSALPAVTNTHAPTTTTTPAAPTTTTTETPTTTTTRASTTTTKGSPSTPVEIVQKMNFVLPNRAMRHQQHDPQPVQKKYGVHNDIDNFYYDTDWGNINEGHEFVVTFGPMHNPQGYCQLVMVSRESSMVRIRSNFGVDEEIIVGENERRSIDLSTGLRTSAGVENKVVMINATRQIVVYAFNSRGAWDMGGHLVKPIYDDSTEFLVVSDRFEPGACDEDAYYTVSSNEPNTVLTINEVRLGTAQPEFTQILQEGECYTAINIAGDLTGTLINSTNPVSVSAGVGCGNVGNSVHLTEQMTPYSQLGNSFVAPPIGMDGQNKRFMLRVLASEDNTEVLVPEDGVDLTLAARTFIDVENSAGSICRVNCSKPCHVSLFYRDTYQVEKNSLLTITPTQHYSKDIMFTVAENTFEPDMNNYVTIVANVASPTIRLNGNIIGSWTAIPGWNFAYTSVPLSVQTHRLWTNEDGEAFGAFIHGHHPNPSISDASMVYTTEAGLGGRPPRFTTVAPPTTTEPTTEEPTTTTTTPTPTPTTPSTTPTTTTTPVPTTSAASDLTPDYKIIVRANFTSRDGDDFTLPCSNQYYTMLGERATDMIPKLNVMIGDTLCQQHHPSQFRIMVTTVGFYTDDTYPTHGIAEVSYRLESLDTQLTFRETHECARECTAYLLPHIEWQIPLLSQQLGCAAPVFEDHIWEDAGHEWFCKEPFGEEQYPDRIPRLPGYEVWLMSDYVTHDGSLLTAQCTQTYLNSLEQKCQAMQTQLNNIVGHGGSLCTGKDIDAYTHSCSLGAQGDEGISTVKFLFTTTNEDKSYQSMMDCVKEVSEYLQPHNPWGIPLLSMQPGCPFLAYTDDTFWEHKRQWYCFQVETPAIENKIVVK